MTSDSKPSAFNEWKARQRELHAVETLILQIACEPPRRLAGQAEADLRGQAKVLREEVERLFPSAMEELEEGVRQLKGKRPRLHQL